jgi:vancomycin resistance protein YoaR
MRQFFVLAVAGSLVFLTPSMARADAQAAQGYLKEAQELIDRHELEDAASKLELAEAELDDATPAEQAPLKAAIDEAKQKIAQATAAADKPKYERKLTNAMSEAEQSIGNLATWPGAEDRVNEVLNDEAAKVALGPELDAAAKKFATFKRLHVRKASVQIEAEVDSNLKNWETEWAESKAKLTDPNTSSSAMDSEIESAERNLTRARKEVGRLDKEDARLKEFTARLDKMAAEFTQLALAGRVKEVADTLHRKVDLYKDDWGGYEKETAGPTWEQFRGLNSEEMSAFLAPRTRVFITRMNGLLTNLEDDEDYKSVQSDPGIKSIVDDVKTKRDAAYAKMVKFIGPVVDGALKSTAKENNVVDRLKDDVRLAIGEKSPEGAAFKTSLEQKLAGNTAATTGAEDAKAKLIVMLQGRATLAWPKLKEGISTTTDYDMSKPDKFKGKNISFTSDNLMGYRFKPGGDFYFATTLGGFPVAGRIDPMLMKQITATETAIGRSLGDDDSDGRWEIIATVTDRKAKLMARRVVEGTAKVNNGADVNVKAEYAEPVDAIVIDIIAAKMGPFAGAKDRAVLKEDGTFGK